MSRDWVRRLKDEAYRLSLTKTPADEFDGRRGGQSDPETSPVLLLEVKDDTL